MSPSTWLGLGGLTLALLSASAHAADGPAIFKGADAKLGAQLIVNHQCAACHARQVGGDGSAIYRPAGRINSAGALRGMVEQCNLRLNLTLFPDEVTAMAAALNQQHYHFQK